MKVPFASFPVRAAFGALALLALCVSTHAQNPPLGGGLCFDGVDDHVRVPYSATFPTEVFSICAWVKAQAPLTNWAVIISRGDDDTTDNLPWDLRIDPNGTFVCCIEDSSDQAAVYDSGFLITDGAWHHVAAVRAANGLLGLYVDGQPVASFGSTKKPSSNNSQFLTLGCVIGSTGLPPQIPLFFLHGMLDEPAMWDRVLSATEVLNVFQSGVQAVSSTGLRGYWNLNAGSGQVVPDLSSAANHGFRGADGAAADQADPDWVNHTAALEVSRLGSPANPDALLPGQTSGPAIGSTWDPMIDHTTFMPGAAIDCLGITVNPLNLFLPPLGTLLCDPTQIVAIATAAAGLPFAVPVPNDCVFVGTSVCTQGASLDALGAILLTNALDITIGTF
jgi:hypothetical protein